MLGHDAEELQGDLAAGAEEHLTLSALLSVADAVEGIVQDVDAHHGDCRENDKREGWVGKGELLLGELESTTIQQQNEKP